MATKQGKKIIKDSGNKTLTENNKGKDKKKIISKQQLLGKTFISFH